MTLPTKSEDVRLYKLRYSRVILKIELLLIALVYATLVLFQTQYDLLPSFIVVTLLSFIFFMRFSVIARFPHGLRMEIRTAPDRLICYDQNGQTTYPMEQIDVRLTRWTILLELGRFPDTIHLSLLRDSFDDAQHYSAFRRFLFDNQAT